MENVWTGNFIITYSDETRLVFNENEVYHVAKDIASALVHIHGLNRAHMDVKPKNMILVDDTVKLIDCAGAEDVNSTDPLVLYTVSYAPPG
jgi:serine/threonine protein kinase